jgi:hypothetical protein
MNNSKFKDILLKIKEIKLLIDRNKLDEEKVDKELLQKVLIMLEKVLKFLKTK